MGSKENTSNSSRFSEEISVTTCYDEQCEERYEQDQILFGSEYTDAAASNVTHNSPPVEVNLSLGNYGRSPRELQPDINFATTTEINSPEQPCHLTVRSLDEVKLMQQRNENRLRYQIREEGLEHAVKIKELVDHSETKLSPLPLSLTSAQSVNPASVNVASTSDDSSSERKFILSCPLRLQVAAFNQLQLQRIQQQIEIEKAVHEIKMKHLKR